MTRNPQQAPDDANVPHDSVDPILSGWAAGMTTSTADGAQLPPHAAHCLGCGPANPHGHHLQAHRHGEKVTATHTFDQRHVGAPGIAHGGAVATVFDDLFGFLLFIVGELAVTRTLQIEYLAPARLDVPYALSAGLDTRVGRRLHVTAQMTHPSGGEVATSTALFVTVPVQHFSRALEG